MSVSDKPCLVFSLKNLTTAITLHRTHHSVFGDREDENLFLLTEDREKVSCGRLPSEIAEFPKVSSTCPVYNRVRSAWGVVKRVHRCTNRTYT